MDPNGSQVTSYREALRQGIEEAMLTDDRVFLLGEDVGHYGGAFAVSKGLLDKFGKERIIDVPLAEAGFSGIAIGAAIGGLKPICEIMTVNFSLLAMDQIINNAATLCHMSGGQISIPVVFRISCGPGRQLAAQHSHSWEPMFSSIPGLKILSAGTIDDARHMLGFALKENNPVIIFEYTGLLNSKTQEPINTIGSPFQCKIRKSGKDISLFTYGQGVGKSLKSAEELNSIGIDVEVIDLRCLRPLDKATILDSIQKTHRGIIVEDAWKTMGIGAEISALITEHAFYDLDAPVIRLGGVEIPIPYPVLLEEACVPQPENISTAIKKLLQHD
jgi:pyruvate dehydrogenase E1 component beta subunit